MLYVGIDYHKRYSDVSAIDEHEGKRASACSANQTLCSLPTIWSSHS